MKNLTQSKAYFFVTCQPLFLMFLLTYFFGCNCTLYLFNTKERDINKIKTVIVNTKENINIDAEKVPINVEELREQILAMPDAEYDKLIFTKEYKKELIYPCLLIVADLSSNCFSSKKNLKLCGCRKMYNINNTYFCSCEYNKCGVVCEYEKNHNLLNVLILICLILLLIKIRKKTKEPKIYVNRNTKQKHE